MQSKLNFYTLLKFLLFTNAWVVAIIFLAQLVIGDLALIIYEQDALKWQNALIPLVFNFIVFPALAFVLCRETELKRPQLTYGIGLLYLFITLLPALLMWTIPTIDIIKVTLPFVTLSLLMVPFLGVILLFFPSGQPKLFEPKLSTKVFAMIFGGLGVLLFVWRGLSAYTPNLTLLTQLPLAGYNSIIVILLTAAALCLLLPRLENIGSAYRYFLAYTGLTIGVYVVLAALMGVIDGIFYPAELTFNERFYKSFILSTVPQYNPQGVGSYSPTEALPLLALALPALALPEKPFKDPFAKAMARLTGLCALVLLVISALLRFIPALNSPFFGHFLYLDNYYAPLSILALAFMMVTIKPAHFIHKTLYFILPMLLFFIFDVLRYFFGPGTDAGDLFLYLSYGITRTTFLVPVYVYAGFHLLKNERELWGF